MLRKALKISSEIDIQAVTCPGVWLYPNGQVYLLLSVLGGKVQTKRLPPVFPLLFHNTFTFKKSFPSAGCLAEVQDALAKENVFAELIQECDSSGVNSSKQLARFHCSALNLLYPSPCSKGLLAGQDIDLLMEASADYPGILSPKIEVSTKTTVTEVTDADTHGSTEFIINPKTLCSKTPLGRMQICHKKITAKEGNSYEKNNNSQQTRPIDMEFIRSSSKQHKKTVPCTQRLLDQHHHPVDRCHPGHPNYNTGNHVRDEFNQCQCAVGHTDIDCSLCSRYNAIFNSLKMDLSDRETGTKTASSNDLNRSNNSASLSQALHAHVDHILEPSAFCDEGKLRRVFDSPHKNSCSSLSVFNRRFDPTPISGFETYSDVRTFNNFNKNLDISKQSVFNSCGDNSYRQLFYTNLEKFYRKLYQQAKNRAECNRKYSKRKA